MSAGGWCVWGQPLQPQPWLGLGWVDPVPPFPDFVVDQMQAVKFAFDIARGMAFLHTLEPLIPRHHLNSRSVMVSKHSPSPRQGALGAGGAPTDRLLLSPDR